MSKKENRNTGLLEKGTILPVGKFNVITQSHKSTPGDGTHGCGVKGGGFMEVIFGR